MKKILRFLRGVVILLLLAALAINLWFMAARLLEPQDLPQILGYSQAVVLSGSMEPAFSAGALLIFKEQDAYEIDDIVIFRQGGAFVTHRIVGAGEGGFVTKGDANNTEDRQLLDPAAIEGELRRVIPGLGGTLNFLRTPLGLLLLIVTGILLIEIPRLLERRGRRDEG